LLAIIDYEAGNLTSVVRSVRALGIEAAVTQDPEVVAGATQIIFPGVGAAGEAMANLHRLGLDRAVCAACNAGVPILGICLGAQIIMDFSEENATPCLGLLPGRTRFLDVRQSHPRLKIPHMGWNQVLVQQPHPVLRDLPQGAEFYFVHSFYPDPADSRHVYGVTSHGREFPSIVGRRNLLATQFHPEKSGRAGLTLLKNFLDWDGADVE